MSASSAGPAGRAVPRPHPHLVEIPTWAWLEQLGAKLGRMVRLADVPDAEWDALARLGFDIVWLMGVWRRSFQARLAALAYTENFPRYDRALPGWTAEDVIASPYAVADYSPDPRIGSWEELDAVREKLRARGMALFLDFVGNHTALDHPWTHEHPEFFVQGSPDDFSAAPSNFYPIDSSAGMRFLAFGRDPYFPPWRDVAQLNHFEPRMRSALLEQLRSIARHCDGVRCDMAMLQLGDIFGKIWSGLLRGASPPGREFWEEAHAAVPDLILLAEAYWGTEQRLLDLGFSWVYDKGLYDAVRDFRIPEIHTRIAAGVSYQSRLARLMENHDEEPCAAVFGAERIPAAAALFGTLPGMRFYYQREIEGCSVYLPITLRHEAPGGCDAARAALFEKILRITSEDVFHQGAWSILRVTPEGDPTSGNLAAWQWRGEKAWKVLAVNLAREASQGRVQFEGTPLPARQYVFYDQLNDVRYLRAADELRGAGLFVRREALGAHLFDVTPA